MQLKSTIFSLWVITQAHPGRSRIQWKKGERKKKNTQLATTQRSLSPSQQGWPPKHHGKRSPEPAAAWPLQHSHENEQHFLTEPISDLLSWVQSGLSSFSYHKEISLSCARDFGLCTVFAQGSVKKYFTRRITLNWIWFESFPSKTSCKGILKLTLKLKDNIKKDYLYWQKGPNFWSMTPCLVAGEPWSMKAFKLAHTELKTILLHRKSFFLVAVLILVHECFALSCLNSTLFLIQFISYQGPQNFQI